MPCSMGTPPTHSLLAAWPDSAFHRHWGSSAHFQGLAGLGPSSEDSGQAEAPEYPQGAWLGRDLTDKDS